MFRLGTYSEDGLVSATALVARLCCKLQTFEAASISRMLFTNHPMARICDLGRSWAVCGVKPMLGTDGFGRSDTRAVLRAFFGVDAKAIAKAAKFALEG